MKTLSQLFEKIVPLKDRKVFWWAVLSALLLFGLDMWTKYAVVKNISYQQRIPVISGFFDLTHVRNFGAAWGILSGRGGLLLLFSALVFCCAILFMQKLTEGWKERYFAILLVMSGILGNSADRIFRGSVVDFLHFYIQWNDKIYAWPSFNVADCCICTGAFLFMISTLCRPERKKPECAATETKPAQNNE